MGTSHALLSPSSAHRWIHCPASPRLESMVEDSGSSYAEEGTLAHAYCARKLKQHLGLPTEGEDSEIVALDGQYHTGEMDEHTDTYAAVVLEKLFAAQARTEDAQLLVETRLEFSRWVPEAFGTADAIIIADGCMEVIDFKYGKGVRVEANGNAQMMIYALGAYDRFGFEYRIERVRMTIVQPRLDNISEHEAGMDELLGWADSTLVPAAKEAYGGNGRQNPGEWCRFCRVKGSCRALATECTRIASEYSDRMLSPFELAHGVLPKLAMIKTWLNGIEEYALGQALQGVHLDGWKVVEGRSIRRITDAGSAAKAPMGEGYDEADVYKPAELRTITELERIVGKKRLSSIIGQWIDKPQGKPTLVPDSDKRSAINPIADDFKSIQ